MNRRCTGLVEPWIVRGLIRLASVLRLLALAAGMAVLAGCASWQDPVRREYDPQTDFSRYRSFLVEPVRPSGEPLVVGQPVPGLEAKVFQAIEQTLSAKGLVPNPDDPDLRVRFITQMRQVTQVDIEQVPTEQGIWTKYLSEPVTEGLLLVNLVDGRSGKVVWKAVTGGQVDPGKIPSQEAVDQLVEQLFAGFPPKD